MSKLLNTKGTVPVVIQRDGSFVQMKIVYV